MKTRFALIAVMIGSVGMSAGAAVRGGSVSKATLIMAAQTEIVKAVSTGPAFLNSSELGSTSLSGRSSSMKNASWIQASIHANRDAMADFSNDPKHYSVLVAPRLSPRTPPKAVVPLSFRAMHTSARGTRVVTFAAKANSAKGAGLLVANVQQVYMTGQWWIKSASVFFVPAGF